MKKDIPDGSSQEDFLTSHELTAQNLVTLIHSLCDGPVILRVLERGCRTKIRIYEQQDSAMPLDGPHVLLKVRPEGYSLELHGKSSALAYLNSGLAQALRQIYYNEVEE